MRSHSRLVPVFVVTAATVALSGCGGSGSPSPSAAAPAAAAQASTTSGAPTPASASASASGPVTVASPADGSLAYDPKQLTAAAGTLRITYDNPGPVPHNIVLEDAAGKTVGSEITPFTTGSRALALLGIKTYAGIFLPSKLI